MSSVDWDEVKRLAADFQKAQLTSTLQKLSERNCVEIITKLIETNLLDVIFTVDGKEYITPDYLEKEIRDELYINGGRIHLAVLAKILNVNLSHVTKISSDIEKRDKQIKIILGQLIDNDYTIKILQEINDKLNQVGYINISELTLSYDLPAEFLQTCIEKGLDKTIKAKQDVQDRRIFYTEDFIARNRAKIRGALVAITKPTPLSAILGLCNMPERIFFSILDNSHGTIQIPGVITGKQSNNGFYIPTIYSKNQSEWVENFYKQNGYLEYDALTRLGISDPKSYIKRHFSQVNLTFLTTVVTGPAIIDQVDANVEEVIATNSFTDIYPLLPSVFTPEDIEVLLKEALKRSKIEFHIFATTVVVSNAFLQQLSKSFETIAEGKAKDAVESGKWMQYIAECKIKSSNTKNIDSNKVDRKDERRKKAASGKAGGGSQGRETKTKSTKKKYHAGKNQDIDYDSDNDTSSRVEKSDFILVSHDDIKKELIKDNSIADIEELVEQLTDFLQPRLNKLSGSIAEQLAQANKMVNLNEMEERLNMIVTNIRIFDKGLKIISNKETSNSLSKYLMKTLGTDFTTEIFKIAAVQNSIQPPNNMTIEARQKMLIELPEDVKNPLNTLHKAIVSSSIEEFLSCIESVMASCSLILRKFDKKREKSLILAHRQALLEQINQTDDPALALHLATSILFTGATQSALHMSGRHVSSILMFLQTHLVQSTAVMLSQYHDLVLEFLSTGDTEKKEETRKSLENKLSELKEIVNNFKNHISCDKVHE